MWCAATRWQRSASSSRGTPKKKHQCLGVGKAQVCVRTKAKQTGPGLVSLCLVQPGEMRRQILQSAGPPQAADIAAAHSA
mmetsp:Transcript_11300/g.20096  ORF Transcript_11300/g.20096 Transcript_11300/m.20096 type:complete len:80 (+) Transcript_11300:2447-2686(+)